MPKKTISYIKKKRASISKNRSLDISDAKIEEDGFENHSHVFNSIPLVQKEFNNIFLRESKKLILSNNMVCSICNEQVERKIKDIKKVCPKCGSATRIYESSNSFDQRKISFSSALFCIERSCEHYFKDFMLSNYIHNPDFELIFE